jgi:hypothetical protein
LIKGVICTGNGLLSKQTFWLNIEDNNPKQINLLNSKTKEEKKPKHHDLVAQKRDRKTSQYQNIHGNVH